MSIGEVVVIFVWVFFLGGILFYLIFYVVVLWFYMGCVSCFYLKYYFHPLVF